VARPAGGPIPRHPHARQGVPPSGGGSARQRAVAGLRGLDEILVLRVVADAVAGLGLDRLAVGSLPLERRGLGLVVGGVGTLDGPLELAQSRRDVRAGELPNAFAAMSLWAPRRAGGIRGRAGTTSRLACGSAPMMTSARP
jgi:hypothetical protein